MLGTAFVKGSPCWIDLGSPNIRAAASFYGEVFGWTFEDFGPEAGGYGFLKNHDRSIGAIGGLDEGAMSAWTAYFAAPDVDAVTKDVQSHGGSVRAEPFDVMDAGRMSQVTDPQGAGFALWQAGSHAGFDSASQVGELLWVELHTPDPDAAFGFYRDLFGWRSQKMDAPGMTYTVVSTSQGDIEDASFGGIAPDDQQGPRWVPYFHVADPDATAARVQTSGGTVLMPAADVPDVGRIAWFADLAGAVFAVLKPDPRQGS